MSAEKRGTAASCDIDALLQETWLQVISLRHGPLFTEEGEGRVFWERCVADVERVQQALQAAGMDETGRQHVLIAQCALLDEVVKSRGIQDDACVQWYDIPLQGHFLGTLEAGDTLCSRMRAVLREPQPDSAVITCFLRVMQLGFLGGYQTLHDAEREKLIRALTEQAPPFRFPQTLPVLAPARSGRTIRSSLASWPLRIGVSVLLLAALWWGLDRGLDQILTTLLPETLP